MDSDEVAGAGFRRPNGLLAGKSTAPEDSDDSTLQ